MRIRWCYRRTKGRRRKIQVFERKFVRGTIHIQPSTLLTLLNIETSRRFRRVQTNIATIQVDLRDSERAKSRSGTRQQEHEKRKKICRCCPIL